MSEFQEFGLDPRIVKGLDSLGFMELFPIQERAISPLLRGRDLIGQAKTGTGKTAAYTVPMLQRIDAGDRRVQGLILTPTRELAVQVAHEIQRMGKYTGIQVVAIYGGQPIGVQLRRLGEGVQILVGTPGRIIDLIRRGAVSLGKVKFAVLDEADTMLDMGFIDDIEYILGKTPSSRQLSLFSATMPGEIIQLSGKYMKNPEKILVDSDEPSVETLDQKYVTTDEKSKLSTLAKILSREKPSNTIIFCATKIRVDRLARNLRGRFPGVAAIHSGLSQNQRDKVMQMFRAQRIRILVATDIAARGLDIPHVDAIINYDVPKNPLIYFHRVGRTARAGGSGRSFILVSRRELEDFVQIQDRTSVTIKPAYCDGEGFSSSIQKYCDRCGRWVNLLSEGGLSKCADCGRILDFGGQEERKTYSVTCSDCGKEAEVPFKPMGGKAVYCRECYQRHRRDWSPLRRGSRWEDGGVKRRTTLS